MIAPTMLPDGKKQDYGFGLAADEVRGRKVIRHGGGIFGFSTEAIYLPEQDMFVAVFTNSDDPLASEETITYRLAAMALGDPFPSFEKAAVDSRSLEPLFGVYAIEGGERRFFARDGKLYTRRSGSSDLEVFAAGGNRFFYGPDNLTWFEISRDPAGKPVMAMHQNGAVKPELARYIGPIPADPKTIELSRSALERYAGSYKAAPGLVTIALADGGGATLQLGPQRPVPIKPVSETEFILEGVDARVVFSMEGGKVTGLVLKQGGREMPATRVD
jgi:D-alanyl-D-alanine carboxypeptidase